LKGGERERKKRKKEERDGRSKILFSKMAFDGIKSGGGRGERKRRGGKTATTTKGKSTLPPNYDQQSAEQQSGKV